jgi:hypothetical protein
MFCGWMSLFVRNSNKVTALEFTRKYVRLYIKSTSRSSPKGCLTWKYSAVMSVQFKRSMSSFSAWQIWHILHNMAHVLEVIGGSKVRSSSSKERVNNCVCWFADKLIVLWFWHFKEVDEIFYNFSTYPKNMFQFWNLTKKVTIILARSWFRLECISRLFDGCSADYSISIIH